MAKNLIDRIKESLAKQGVTPRTKQSREWLLNKVKDLNPSREKLLQDQKRLKETSIIGKMYFYFYDPKHKDNLEYYDTFPLVIPIELYKDGFLGLNLHYIHPKNRVVMLDKLSKTLTDNTYTEKTKMQISYDYLKSASRVYESTPCVKRYLYSQVKSRFLEVPADEWDIAVMLPVESFVGANASKVYSDSRKKF